MSLLSNIDFSLAVPQKLLDKDLNDAIHGPHMPIVMTTPAAQAYEEQDFLNRLQDARIMLAIEWEAILMSIERREECHAPTRHSQIWSP